MKTYQIGIDLGRELIEKNNSWVESWIKIYAINKIAINLCVQPEPNKSFYFLL